MRPHWQSVFPMSKPSRIYITLIVGIFSCALSCLANAATHTINVESVAELRAALGDLENPEFDAGDRVIILVADGDYLFDELQATGNAVPEPPENIDLDIRGQIT